MITNKDAYEFALTQAWGFVPTTDPGDVERIVKAVLTIVGADGEISDEEWKYLANLARVGQLSADQFDAWREFDFKIARLEDLVEGLPPGVRLGMLYTAIQAASADGYHDHERAAAAKAARLLGVSPTELASIEGIVAIEEQIRVMKRNILGAA